MKGRGKREIPEKTRRPAASSGTIPTCENPDHESADELLLIAPLRGSADPRVTCWIRNVVCHATLKKAIWGTSTSDVTVKMSDWPRLAFSRRVF
ncbi:hypothetical protein PR048_019241 [Dryococelus australis]|uniref:Uncharacterized protein n=1 Tax=Dryococelus australis TaxID=614101 RepID=A0ABQ9H2Z0_9NEOP|nr:hypothetical protein PR048_019241 [Dryococelus australis]